MYFFFNESNKEESRVATIAGHGQRRCDLATAGDYPISAATPRAIPCISAGAGTLRSESRRGGAASQRGGRSGASLVAGNTLVDLGGDWTLDLNGKQVTGPLKSWQDLARHRSPGPATYRKQFTVSAAPAGKRLSWKSRMCTITRA